MQAYTSLVYIRKRINNNIKLDLSDIALWEDKT